MEEIKDLVSQALEQKRVLSKLKAELRAQVFLAIDEQEQKSGRSGLAQKTDNLKRASLHASDAGMLLVGLVHEFLEWSGMEFTLKVFEPEMSSQGSQPSRAELSKQLGLTPDPDAPLLMCLLSREAKEPSGPPTKPAVANSQPALVSKLSPPLPTNAIEPKAVHKDTPPSVHAAAAAPAAKPHVTPAVQPTLERPALPTAKPAAQPAQAAVGEHSYADDIDVDIDDDLDGAEILDDDEDYESVFASKQPASSVVATQPSSQPPQPTDTAASLRPNAPAKPEAVSAEPNEDSSLSATYIPGRLRPLRRLSGTGASSSLQEDAGSHLNQSAGGDVDRSLDIMTGDRSFGISHELGSHAVARHSQSGGLSFSGELPGPPGADQAKAASTSMSGEFSRPAKLDALPTTNTLGLKPPLPKLGALAPLGKPGALPPPAQRAPLGPVAGLAPLSAPAAASGTGTQPLARKDPKDVKAELRKAGLLTSNSYSMGSGSAEDSDIELPDNTAQEESQEGHRRSTSGSGGPGQQPADTAPGAAKPAIRPVHGGVYDAEVSVMTSADQSMDIPADTVEEELRSSVESEGGLGRSGLGGGMYQPSKGLSMDMRDTGLSASDKSGELMNADFAETAEWS